MQKKTPDREGVRAAFGVLLGGRNGLPKKLAQLLRILSSDEAMHDGLSSHDLYNKLEGHDPRTDEDLGRLRVYSSKLRSKLEEHFGKSGELAATDWYCTLPYAREGGKQVNSSDNRYLLEWHNRTPRRDQTIEPEHPEEGFWVAVLPFRSSSAEAASLADGLTEEITTRLTRFSYLRVVTRRSANNSEADMRAAGSQIGARYLIEGSLHEADKQIRAYVRLVDAATDIQLWAQTYERPFNKRAAFKLQDYLIPRIVATIANGYGGVLCRAISQAVRNRPFDSLTAYELLMRAYNYYDRITPGEHAVLRNELELAVARHVGDANLHAVLASFYLDEHRYGFNPLPDSLGRAYKHAQLAVDCSPSNHLARQMLASAHFYRRDLEAFRAECKLVLDLNPYDQSSAVTMAYFLCCSGDIKGGMALWKSCADWAEAPPGWFWVIPYFDCYSRKDYRAALDMLRKISMPNNPRYQAYFAAVYGQLGDEQGAAVAVDLLFKAHPGFDALAEFCNTFAGELLEHFLDGLRKAGLGVSPAARAE